MKSPCLHLCSVLLALLMFSGLSCKKGGEASDAQAAQPRTEHTTTVTVTTIVPIRFTETIQTSATVKAFEDVMLSPEEGGVLATWTVERGAHVSKGTVIGILKDDVLKASYDAAVAQFNIADMNFTKQEKVYSEQAVSELQYKSAGYSRDAAKAQADLVKARWEHTRLRSPIDGILEDRFVDEGEMAAPGVPVARIVNIASVKVQATLPERHAGSITRGIGLRLTVAAYAGRVFSGRVTYVGATLSADNKTFLVEAVVPNPDRALKPEMVGHATIHRSSRDAAIVIPEDIVQQVDRNLLIVFVDENGTARQRIVALGARTDNQVEIVSGLAAGDRLITVGFKGLVDGQSIVTAQ